MKSTQRLAFIVILSTILFGANISGISIYMLDEAKNSTCAREMMETGNYAKPTFNYTLRTDKPPFHYFFMILAYKMFGVNEFGARFFSAISGICTTLFIWFFTRKMIDEKTAFWSCIVFLSSIQVITQFHQSVPDPYLVFLFSGAMLCFFAFYQQNKKNYLYLAYILLGLGLLSKGPVVLVLAGVSLFLFLAFEGQLKRTWSFKPFTGLLIALLIAAPWYVAAGRATNGEFLEGFFLKHNVERFSKPMEGHSGSIFLIPAFIIWGLFPFSIFLFQAVGFAWKKRHPLVSLSITVILVVMVFFSVSATKLPNYPAPCFPFVAILLGYFFSHANFGTVNYRLNISTVIYALIVLALPVAAYIALGTVLNMSGKQWLGILLSLPAIGAIISIVLFNRQKFKPGFTVIATSWILTTLLFYWVIYPPIDKENAVQTGLRQIDISKPIYHYGIYNPAYSFYLKKPVIELPDINRPPAEVYVLTRKSNLASDTVSLKAYSTIIENKEMFEPQTSVILFSGKDAVHTQIIK